MCVLFKSRQHRNTDLGWGLPRILASGAADIADFLGRDGWKLFFQLAGHGIDVAKLSHEYTTATFYGPNNKNDCLPLQHGLARMFCDLHCVRDAVKAGDAAILANLEEVRDFGLPYPQLLNPRTTQQTGPDPEEPQAKRRVS